MAFKNNPDLLSEVSVGAVQHRVHDNLGFKHYVVRPNQNSQMP